MFGVILLMTTAVKKTDEWINVVPKRRKNAKKNTEKDGFVSLSLEEVMNLSVLATQTADKMAEEQKKTTRREKKAKNEEKKKASASPRKKHRVEIRDTCDGPFLYDRHCSCGADFSSICEDELTGETYLQIVCPICGAKSPY